MMLDAYISQKLRKLSSHILILFRNFDGRTFLIRVLGNPCLSGRAYQAFATLLILTFHYCNSYAATKTTNASGNWSSTSTWVGGVLPAAGDDILINNGHTLTVDGSYTCNSVSFEALTGGSGSGSGTLSVNPSQILNITGGIFAPEAAVAIKVTGNYSISGSGTINCASINIGNSQTPTGSGITAITLSSTINNLNISGNLVLQSTYKSGGSKVNNSSFILQTGTTTIGGTCSVLNEDLSNTPSLIMNTGAQTGSLIFSGATPFTINQGTLTTTFNGTTAKVTYSNAGAQTVRPSTYTNLTLAGGGSKTMTSVTVNGVLSIEGTATASVAPTYGTAATLQYNTSTDRIAAAAWITPFVATGGVIIANTGQITLDAAKVLGTNVPLTINSGAKLNTSGTNFGLTFNGDFINNGTLTANASDITIAGTATQNIAGFTTTGNVSMTKTSGTATATGDFNGNGLIINGTGGTLNLGTNRTHTFSGNWTRTAGTLDGGSNTLLQIGGSAINSGSTFIANTGTVKYYNGTGGQTIAGVTYNNLQVNNGSGTNTALGDITANTISTAGGGTLNMAGFQLLGITTASGVGGTIRTQNTSSTPIPAGLSWGGLVQYDATAGGQTIVTGSYSNISSGGTSGTNTLGGDISVNNTLTIASGTTLSFGTGIAGTITLSGVAVSGLNNNGTLNMSSGGGSLSHQLIITPTSLTNFGTLTNGTNSTVEYNGAAQTISAVNYNHLIIRGTGAKTFQASPVTISGNLTISGTASVSTNAALTVNGLLTIGGSTSFNAGSYSHILKGNIVINGSFTPLSSTVILNGSSSQSISGLGITSFNNLTINNAVSVTLGKEINVNGALTFMDGKISTTATNILNMGASSSTSGSSATSFVDGPMTKTGSSAFEFPIGEGAKWARLAIGIPSSSTTFSAQYFGSSFSNTTNFANTPLPALGQVSSKEYWLLNQPSGSATATVTLYWEDAIASNITDCSSTKLRVAHWDGSAWENNNNGSIVTGGCSGGGAGTVTTSSDVMSFSPFTFGWLPAAFPVELESFSAKCQGNKVLLNWATASELNNDFFQLERSINGVDWEIITKVNGGGTSQAHKEYETSDKAPYAGTNYYRLKQVDIDGKSEYTDVISVEFCGKTLDDFQVFPNPSSGKFDLLPTGNSEDLKSIQVFNSIGKLIETLNPNETEIDLTEFPDGQYILRIITVNSMLTKQVIKTSH